MHKAASRKIRIFLSCFILVAWAACLPATPSGAGLHELSEGEMAAVYAYGFSEFTLTGDLARINFNNITISTWTEISSMKMGYYDKGGTTAWDNDWTTVSAGTSGSDLVGKGLFIEAKFSNIAGSTTRTLEYLRIGTPNLLGTVSANFNSFSGTVDGVSYIRQPLGAATITANNTGADKSFYLSLERSGSQMGYSFHWGSATKTP